MQCPDCQFEAPAAAFGDPLRCPECGIFYEKAVKLAKSAPAAAPTSSSEKTFLQTPHLVITNARFVVGRQTYAMAAVSSVRVDSRDMTPSNTVPGLILIVSAIWLLGAFIATSSNLLNYLLPLIGLIVGFIWWRSIKKKFEYQLVLTTTAGEKSALKSFTESDIRSVENALNQAIIYRG